jgi:hypothetical protein
VECDLEAAVIMDTLLVTPENLRLMERLFSGYHPGGMRAGDAIQIREIMNERWLVDAVAYHAANIERERIVELLTRLPAKECADHTSGGYYHEHNPARCSECRKRKNLGSCYDKELVDDLVTSLCGEG